MIRLLPLCLLLGCDAPPREDAAAPDGGVVGGGADAGGDAGCGQTRLEARPLGVLRVQAGVGGPIELALPADVLSLTVLLFDAADEALAIVSHLEGPHGQRLVAPDPAGVVFDDDDWLLGPFAGQFHSPNRVTSLATGVAGMLAPNAPQVALEPGRWRLWVAAVDPDTEAPTDAVLDVLALVKRAASAPTCGALELHLFLTGARGWTATMEHPDLIASLAEVRAVFAAAGVRVRIGSVQEVEVPPVLEAGGGPGSALHQMFARNPHAAGVGVFLVTRLARADGAAVAGVAGGQPGPSGRALTVRSGVAVSVGLLEGPAEIGRVIAHELGHYLGLFHTVEGAEVDPLPDTSTDPEDRRNLMHPQVTAEPATLSADQAWVIERSAAVGSVGDAEAER